MLTTHPNAHPLPPGRPGEVIIMKAFFNAQDHLRVLARNVFAIKASARRMS
jgi:hypothetical protein